MPLFPLAFFRISYFSFTPSPSLLYISAVLDKVLLVIMKHSGWLIDIARNL